ncbi:hypothetical protein F442_06236, partial [Phytophthora nicotianae P10297]
MLQPPRGCIQACAAKYGCSDDQVFVAQSRSGHQSRQLHHGRKGKSGRTSRMTEAFREDLNRSIEFIPFEDRTDIHTLARALGIQKSTLYVYYRAGVFRSHTARVKPMLTEKQHVDGVKFALGFVHRGPSNTLMFDSMTDYVHLDEKWFYPHKEKQRFYLGEHEDAPHITQHRIWDGKVGLWPFVVYEPAERSSKNRPA